MKKCWTLGVPPLLLCAVALAQTGTKPQPPQPNPATSPSPASGATGSNQQTGGVAGGTTPSPLPQSDANKAPAIGSNPGATAGNAASSGITTETAPPLPAPPSDAELQNQIQTALGKEPTLSHDSVTAHVSPQGLELSGTVASRKEKITATRIAQSFAPGKKLADHLKIAPLPEGGAQSQNPPVSSDKPQAVEGKHTPAEERSNEKQPSAPHPPK